VFHNPRMIMAWQQCHQWHGTLSRVRWHFSATSIAVCHPGFSPQVFDKLARDNNCRWLIFDLKWGGYRSYVDTPKTGINPRVRINRTSVRLPL
jgi:hypothetical protein